MITSIPNESPEHSNYTKGTDVLVVLAQQSNMVVHTPPKIARELLESLPSDIWTDPNLKWLDPVSKTGVFLREITEKLMLGLANAIPDEQVRLNHILKEMVYGVAVTEVSAMVTRRTLYGSRFATSNKDQIEWKKNEGNIWFERLEHTFHGENCRECKARVNDFGPKSEENHCYGFIHAEGREKIQKEFNVKFDVIVGNPPYHMTDGGGRGDATTPLYNKFVSEAIALNPKYICMIIPSRWMAGGKASLENFRSEILNSEKLEKLVDYQDASMVFPSIALTGGVQYFLWNRDYKGPCEVTNLYKLGSPVTRIRKINQFEDVLVRFNEAIPIIEKVISKKEETFDTLVSRRNPFGFASSFQGKNSKGQMQDPILLYGLRSESWIKRSSIWKGEGYLDKWKVFFTKASDGNEIYPLPVLTEPIVAGPKSACTETYLMVGPLKSKQEAQYCIDYMKTRFFRFLLSLRKVTQNTSKDNFKFIPLLPLDRTWTDEELYFRYKLTKDEIKYIESQIREFA